MIDQIRLTKVWLPDNSCLSGTLVFQPEPVIRLDSGEDLIDITNNIIFDSKYEFVVGSKFEIEKISLSSPVKVILNPLFITKRMYSRNESEQAHDIYPPSSKEWYGRYLRGRDDAFYIVQPILESEHKWLTIVDTITGEIFESHRINQYEYEILQLKTSHQLFSELSAAITTLDYKKAKKEVLQILDEPSISWDEINRITGGSIPPSFQRGTTTRETLQGLVDIKAFPTDTHEEVLAFLAWTAIMKLPDYDINEFVNNARVFPVFSDLIRHHFKFVLDNIVPPEYCTIVNQVILDTKAERKSLEEELSSQRLDVLLARRIASLAPDWHDDVIEIVKILSQYDQVITVIPSPELPIGKFMSTQKMEYAVTQWGLRIRGNVFPNSIGLRELVYLGAAHRWPHKHLAFSIRLGPVDKTTPYMQTMIMPPEAAEKVKRALPTVVEMDFDIIKLNLNLYNQTKHKWITQIRAIKKSLGKNMTASSLRKKYKQNYGGEIYGINELEARIIDMTSSHFYLVDLNFESACKYWNTDAETTKQVLNHLRDKGVIDLSYWFQLGEHDLSRLVLQVEGEVGKVCSLVDSLIRNCPTTRALVARDSRYAIIISRISDESESFFERTLPQIGQEVGLDIRYFYPSLFRNYTPNLYQRLLREPEVWDADVSGFLSQIRSMPKN